MVERVLITGARAAAALDLARDFRAAGFEPHLADCSTAFISRWSKAVAGFHRYPSPRRDGVRFRQRIRELADELDARLVVPVCEEVFHLAAAGLEGRLFAPPLPVLRQLHDKLAFAQACADWGLPVPESLPLEGDFTGESYDWVFKPRFSRFGEAALIGPSPAQVAALPVDGSWLAQRRIVGREASFYAVAHEGRLTAFTAYRSDWRLASGASFAFEPLERGQAETLRAHATTLAQAAPITGHFACDAMIDAEHRAWLIECNPRATSGVHLLAGDGRLARAMIGEAIEHHSAPAHLAPAMVVYGLSQALRTRRLAQWRRTMATGFDALARPGDRLPLLGALIDTAGFSFAALRHGISTSAATTRDIEWNGEVLP